MQSFDAEINQIIFSFIRVTYGNGELWYHVSFARDEKRITFRMNDKESVNWNVFDTQDPLLLQLANHFSQCIADFEKKLRITLGRGDIIKAAAAKLMEL